MLMSYFQVRLAALRDGTPSTDELSRCPRARVFFWMRQDASIRPHLGLDSIKRSMETTQHCCLATATIPLVFCCYGTAVQISL